MAIAIDPTVPIEFVLKSEQSKPKEEQTIWLFKALTARAAKFYADKYKNNAANEEDILNLVQENLVGWRNFKNAKGEEIEFEEGNVDANMDRLSLMLCVDLAMAFFEANKISAEKRKN